MNADGPRRSFLRACALDVLVPKPGNVSVASPGHGMQAAQFIASAAAASAALFTAGSRVGARIEGAVQASWAAAGCNTNLGIVLLCAPIAAAAERLGAGATEAQWRAQLQAVLAALDVADAAAAYRAIAQANPGGLGRADAEDVNAPPSIGLRDAMALAAGRDRIARQYRDGFAELFDLGLPALPRGFSLNARVADEPPDAATTTAVQRLYLAWLASGPDSHIVRKHGEALAQNVMAAAQGFLSRAASDSTGPANPGWTAWDTSLKALRINPGTSADLTVATLMLAGLCSKPAASA